MALQLTAKENMLMKDQKSHEELCVKKYQSYANQAQDPQLKQLFSSLAQKEQQHLDTVNQILSGQVPNVQQGQSQQGQAGQQGQPQQGQAGQQGQPQQNQSKMQGLAQGSTSKQNDSTLCDDMLTTEKYISSAYDTAIFETTNTNVRQVLNHIQKEEQEHGEQIFNYMQNNGMYNAQ